MIISVLRIGLMVAVTALVSGCLGGVDPTYYLLEQNPRAANGSDAPPPAELQRIGLKSVTLPGYARDRQIASRDTNGRLVLDEANRWAEAPDAAMTRAIADNLRSGLNATVLVEPWPIGFEPDMRVQVIFDTMLRSTDGRVEMAGQYHLLSGDGRHVEQVKSFALTEGAGTDAGYQAFMQSVSAGLARLSAEIREAMIAAAAAKR